MTSLKSPRGYEIARVQTKRCGYASTFVGGVMALGGMLVALEVASFGCLAAGNLPRPVNDGIYVLMAAACAVGSRVAWKRRG